MGVTGDFKGLQRLRSQLAAVTDSTFLRGLSANLGEEALDLVADGFARQRDPYGRPWKRSIRARLKGGETLSESARMRRGFNRKGVDARPEGFTIGTDVAYALSHQKGLVIKAKNGKGLRFQVGGRWVTVKQVRMPVRMMVPEGTLGPIWAPALEEAGLLYVEGAFAP